VRCGFTILRHAESVLRRELDLVSSACWYSSEVLSVVDVTRVV
jgi:hypothetical protein